MQKLISVVTPCFNEEENISAIYGKVKKVFEGLPYSYEHIFIDNASGDGTLKCLRDIAAIDMNVKIIVNSRNFGVLRSQYYALLQAKGNAAILVVADMQDPPELIPEFIRKWEEGYKVVVGVILGRDSNRIMTFLRNVYYYLLAKLSHTDLIKNFTGFGLYDRKIIEIIRSFGDKYPYLRGMIAEIGFETARIPYRQPVRFKGKTTNNFYSLYDIAMLGLTGYSKIPLRIAVMIGSIAGVASAFAALVYLVYKLLFWESFSLGMAPMVIGLFFFSSVQLFFLGILGEYIGSIHTQCFNRPLIIEKERINFDN